MAEQPDVRRGEAGAHTYLGVSANILAGAEHTGERFSMVELTLQAGAGMPRHDHPDVVVGWYVLAGTVTVDTDDGPLLLVVFAPSGAEGFFVAAAEQLPCDVPQTRLADDTLQTLAKLADRHGWQLDPNPWS